MEDKDWKTAEGLLQRILAIQRDNDWAITELGIMFFHSGNLEAAKAKLEESLKIKPKFDAFYWLGRTYWSMGG
jgi:tetratricopeptide (TPR) repeat protein